jgi:LCP family protein required for cell wall assembly
MNGHDLLGRPRWPYGRGRWPFAVLDVLLASLVGLCVLAEARLNRVDAVSPYPLKPTWGRGQDWLLVSRDEPPGPGRERPEAPPAVGDDGRRADAIMLLHLPHDGGKPILVSLPLASSVVIAGYGPGSLGAAFDRGGPNLLVRTFEAATRLSIERYAKIDLGGLAAMVDVAGGVRVCRGKPARPGGPMPYAPRACPTLSGAQALDYLRARSTSAHGDLDRAERQRRLLTALIEKVASPAVALDPARSISLVRTIFGAITVDKGNHLYDLIRLALTLLSDGLVTATVPTTKGGSVPGVGPVVVWDPATMGGLIAALAVDRPVPKGLITD